MLLASRALPCKEIQVGCNVKVVHSRARGASILGVGCNIGLEERYDSCVFGRFGKDCNSNMSEDWTTLDYVLAPLGMKTEISIKVSEGALVRYFGKYLLSNHEALALPNASTCGHNIPIILAMPKILRDP